MKTIIKYILISFIIVSGLFLFALSHQIAGWRIFIVSSGSMEPTISTGSVVMTKSVSFTDLKKGDVITFVSPQNQIFVTHRIEAIKQANQITTFITKGDNNKKEDQWILTSGGVIGKVTYTIPLIGYLFSFLQTNVGILLFILLPSTLILLEEGKTIATLVKNYLPNKTPVIE